MTRWMRLEKVTQGEAKFLISTQHGVSRTTRFSALS